MIRIVKCDTSKATGRRETASTSLDMRKRSQVIKGIAQSTAISAGDLDSETKRGFLCRLEVGAEFEKLCTLWLCTNVKVAALREAPANALDGALAGGVGCAGVHPAGRVG